MADATLEHRIKLLEDESALRKLINVYHKRADAFQWEAWAETFTEDSVFIFAGNFGTMRGRKQILEVCKGQMDHVYKIHHHIMVNLDFEVDGSDEATGTGNLIFTGMADAGTPTKYYQSGGRYRRTFRRTPEGWRIARTNLDFLWKNGADAENVFVDREKTAA